MLVAWLLAGAPDARAQLNSPGKLARPHARLDASCAACHDKNAGGKITAARCLRCHKVLRARIRAKRGYHVGKTRCGQCHKDHLGRGQALVKWPGGRAAFDHRLAGHALVGEHRKVAADCGKCHRPDRQRDPAVRRWPTARRQRTKLGLWRACYTCHQDPHKGQLGSSCESCHDPRGFKPVKRFYKEHRRTRFPLRGAHLRVPCVGCHRKKGAASWRFKGVAHASCADCHQSPHRGTMGQGSRRRACSECHTESGFSRIAFARTLHPKSYPLRGGHARARCVGCHGKKGNRRRVPRSCIGCHKDPHADRFGKRCASCHNVDGWRVSRRKLVRAAGEAKPSAQREAALAGIPAARVQAVAFHDKTRYPLTGRHALVPCAKCHGRRKSKKLPPKRFASCSGCHRDVHKGQFRQRRSLPAKDRRCEGCHKTTGWRLTTFDLRRHDGSRFPLRGAHRAVACKRCHAPSRGAAKRFTFRLLDCDQCHRDPHRGNFRSAATDRRLPCQKCHSSAKPFREPTFDHSKTRMPLHGKHAATACASCHRPDARGVTSFGREAKAARCADCHRDSAHQGQFAAGKRRARGCDDCHGVRSFKIKRFDHARKAGFALRGKHRELACGRCHQTVKLGGGARVRLYRLGRRDCGGCHATPHGRIAKRLAKRPRRGSRGSTAQLPKQLAACERCHTPRGWSALKRRASAFDHRLVGYTLEGRHKQASCASCHKPRPGGRALDRRCASCHEDKHRGRLGQRCHECHTPLDWKPSNALARHRKTRLPLVGRHALTDCTSCHPRAEQAEYRGVPSTCYGCHAREYQAPTTAPPHAAQGFSRRCQQCHRPTGWSPAFFGSASSALASHQRRFPLTGRHRQLDCKSCHRGTKRPRRSCVGCHRKDRARAADHAAPGFARCQRCHSTSRWRPASASWHDRVFRISSGKHRGVSCRSCHADGTDFRRASCTAACHPLATTQRKHRGRPGYRYESRACVRCHRR